MTPDQMHEIQALICAYPAQLRMSNIGDKAWALAGYIDQAIPSRIGLFDPDKVTIERHRLSVTQGEVSISYDGRLMGRFHDPIRMLDKDETVPPHAISGYAGRSDEQLTGSAKTLFYAGQPLQHIDPMCTVDPTNLVRFLGEIVVRANPLVHPNFSVPTSLAGLQARAIIAGYLSGGPFRAIKRDVRSVSGQCYAEQYWRAHGQLEPDEERQAYLEHVQAVLDNAETLPEYNEYGAQIEHGLISEDAFYRRTEPAEGWYDLPTEQEPYVMVRVHPAQRRIRTYSEGSYTDAQHTTADAFADEIAATVAYYVDRNGPGVMADLPEALMDACPELEKTVEARIDPEIEQGPVGP